MRAADALMDVFQIGTSFDDGGQVPDFLAATKEEIAAIIDSSILTNNQNTK